MSDLRLDHLLTYMPGRNLDDHLAQYRSLGFEIDPYHNRVSPGIETGFVRLGHQSLEIFAVLDDAAFKAQGGKMPFDPDLRYACRPFALGFQHPDVAALQAAMIARGVAVPEVYAVRDAHTSPDAPPTWRYLILDQLLPGLAVFALSYGGAPRIVPPVAGANGLHALGGLILITADPAVHAAAWQHLLFPDARLQRFGDAVMLPLPDGVLWWLTPAEFAARFGRADVFPHRYGEFGAAIVTGAGHGLTAVPCRLPDGRAAGFVPARQGDGLALLIPR